MSDTIDNALCIKGCGTVTTKKHCASKNCHWFICVKDKVVFDPEHINREFAWNGGEK